MIKLKKITKKNNIKYPKIQINHQMIKVKIKKLYKMIK